MDQAAVLLKVALKASNVSPHTVALVGKIFVNERFNHGTNSLAKSSGIGCLPRNHDNPHKSMVLEPWPCPSRPA